MRSSMVAGLVAALVSFSASAVAQQVQERDFGAALRSQQFQERVEMFRELGMDEDQATLFALLSSSDMDASQVILLMMLMSQPEGGNGDALGLFLLMEAMKKSQAQPTPVVMDRGEILLIVEGGVLYKIRPDTMEVVGQLNYTGKGVSSDQMLAMLVPAFARMREKAQQATCLNNLKQLAQAALMYAQEHGDKLPPAGWVAELEPFHQNAAILRCPAQPNLQVAYAMNARLLGAALERIARPAETVLFFEINREVPQPTGGPELVPAGGTHDGRISVVYVDGHCQLQTWEQVRQQLEQPPW